MWRAVPVLLLKLGKNRCKTPGVQSKKSVSKTSDVREWNLVPPPPSTPVHCKNVSEILRPSWDGLAAASSSSLHPREDP
jgi:hypothetical protein